MKLGHAIFIICLFTVQIAVLAPAQTSVYSNAEVRSFLESLDSQTNTDRIRVAREIIAQGQRADVEATLIAFLAASDRKTEEWENACAPFNIAIWILGEFRSKKAIPYLVERFEPSGHLPVSNLHTRFSPVEKALISIGLPSVRPLVERAKDGPSYWHRDRFYMKFDSLLNEIAGREVALKQIKLAIDAEQNINKKQELQQLLRVTEDRLLGGSGRFHPIIYSVTRNGYVETREIPVDHSAHPLKQGNDTNTGDRVISRITVEEDRERLKGSERMKLQADVP